MLLVLEVGFITTQQSYVLDMRTAVATPTPPVLSTEDKIEQMLARYIAQPPLNFFHRQTAKSFLQTSAPSAAVNVPLIS